MFRRDDCPTAELNYCPDAAPSCPVCPLGQHCELASQNCNECPKTYCAADAAKVLPKSSSPNIGAIAGGVVGGVVAIAVAIYLIWRFCVKNKRKEYEAEYVDQYSDQDNAGYTQAEKDFNARRDARASTHTVQSIASSVMTRASNIIQIAYIPGVTNRSAPSTPGLLVPPVPPIPIALSGHPSPSYEDQHFFMPGDLRDSTYSNMTGHLSYAPTRASVASTIYGKNAVVPMPAQTVMRGKAAVISVRSTPNGTLAGDATPPMPNIDLRFKKDDMQPPPSPAFSVGSTFLNSASASTATHVRPGVVKVASYTKINKSKAPTESDAEELTSPKSPAVTVIDDSPSPGHGPFGDPIQHQERARGHTKKGSLSAVIEEATRRASTDAKVGLGRKRDSDGGPFSDSNATRE